MTQLIGDFRPDKFEAYRVLSGLLQFAVNNYNNAFTGDISNRYFFEMISTEPKIGELSEKPVTKANLIQQGARKYIEVSTAAKTLMAITNTGSLSEARTRVNQFVNMVDALERHLMGVLAEQERDYAGIASWQKTHGEDIRIAKQLLANTQVRLEELIEGFEWQYLLDFNWNTVKAPLVIGV